MIKQTKKQRQGQTPQRPFLQWGKWGGILGLFLGSFLLFCCSSNDNQLTYLFVNTVSKKTFFQQKPQSQAYRPIQLFGVDVLSINHVPVNNQGDWLIYINPGQYWVDYALNSNNKQCYRSYLDCTGDFQTFQGIMKANGTIEFFWQQWAGSTLHKISWDTHSSMAHPITCPSS